MRTQVFIPVLVIAALLTGSLLTGCGGGGGGGASSSGSGTGTGSEQLKPGLLVGAYGNVRIPDMYGITQADGTVTPTSADTYTAEINSGQPATIIGLFGSSLADPHFGASMTITKNTANNTYDVSLTSQSNGTAEFTLTPGVTDGQEMENKLNFLLPGPQGFFLDILGKLLYPSAPIAGTTT